MALLEAREVCVRYGGLVAVDGVSLSVAPGEVVGLVGPNGAGKTSLLDALSGVRFPEGGRVLLDGRDVTEWNPEHRAALGMARTFQRLELFRSMTVWENLLVAAEAGFGEAAFIADLTGRPTRGRAGPLVGEVLARVGLDEVADRRADQLSTGLGRLVEIGRALCTNPWVLLLDEPAGGLDEAETERLAGVLAGLVVDGGLAVLMVEHDMRLVMDLCHRVAVMDFGRVIAQGTPEEVRRDPAVRAAYLGTEVTEVTEVVGGRAP